MQNALTQAYQADVLIRKSLTCTVGTRYPFKDQVVLTCENIERQADDIFSYTHVIEVVVKCENHKEAGSLNLALREYLAKDMMLPLSVGVFQKPFTKENQKSRRYFAFANITPKDLMLELPKFEKDKSLKYALGASPIESNVVVNGFDLTYSVTKFSLDKTVYTIEDAKQQKREIKEDIYKLILATTSSFEYEDGSQAVELINFEIACESESQIIELAKVLQRNQNNGVIFTCKGKFPRAQKDYFVIPLSKKASDLLIELNTQPVVKSEPKA